MFAGKISAAGQCPSPRVHSASYCDDSPIAIHEEVEPGVRGLSLRLLEHAVKTLGIRTDRVSYRHYHIGRNDTELICSYRPRRSQAGFGLDTVSLADDRVPVEPNRRATYGNGGKGLFDANEVNVLLAVKGGAVGNTSRVVERDHPEVIADLVLHRVAERMVERRTDGAIGRPGKTAVERIAIVKLGQSIVGIVA